MRLREGMVRGITRGERREYEKQAVAARAEFNLIHLLQLALFLELHCLLLSPGLSGRIL